MRKLSIALALLLALLFGAESCDDGGPSNPTPDSDSQQKYDTENGKATIPVDTQAYVITGQVVGPVNDLTHQVSPAQGSQDGYLIGGYGSMNGSFTGAQTEGKSFVRLFVTSAQPSTDLAPVGEVTIIKASDTKAQALINGDIVTFKCRRQYEALAAVQENQKFDEAGDETWELDYCRLDKPVIQVK